MRLEIDGHGFRLEVVWQDVRAALKALLPLLTAGAALLAALEVVRLGTLLGWW